MYIDIVLTFLSLILLFFIIQRALKLLKQVKKKDMKRTWIVIYIHTFFFFISFISYLLSVTLLPLNIERIRLLSGVVFFNRALFIFVVMWLLSKLIGDLQKKSLQLRNWNIELIEKVRKRTSELTRSNKLKDLFISIMDHDLKNPIASIRGFANLIKPKTKNKKIISYTNIIINDSNNMSELINDARTYSKLDQNEYKKESIKINIDSMFKELKKEFYLKLKDRNINLIISKTNFHFKGLPLIKEVFHNVIDNSIKYGLPKTNIKIRFEKSKETVLFSISNKGKTIKNEYKELIFNRFERANAKEAIEGSGLGLSICKHIVELHKGKIWVEDDPKGGVIFKIQLPI